MASIIQRTEVVKAACESALKSIADTRQRMVDSLVSKEMENTVYSISQMKRVPKYNSREEALEAVKNVQDFFGSTYLHVQLWRNDGERAIRRLKAMCEHAGVIRLDSADFELIRGHFPKDGDK